MVETLGKDERRSLSEYGEIRWLNKVCAETISWTGYKNSYNQGELTLSLSSVLEAVVTQIEVVECETNHPCVIYKNLFTHQGQESID